MNRLLAGILLFCSFTWTTWAAEPPVPIASGSTIEFPTLPGDTPRPALQLSPLQDLLWIGWLNPSDGATPYLLVSGTSPKMTERSLFIVDSSNKNPPQRITFPGKLLDPKTRELIHESRAFYGRCIPQQKHDAVILFQRDRHDRKHRLKTSVFIAEASPGMLSERLVERRLPSIATVQKQIRSRKCTEISGKNRTFDPAFFQFRKRGADLPDDEQEEENDKDFDKEDDSPKKTPSET